MPDEPMIAVCAREQCFADDLPSTCSRCAHPIWVRPHTAARIPERRRVCVACFVNISHGDDDVRLFVSEDTIRELADLGQTPPLPFHAHEILPWARQSVANGAGHDCGEWVREGRCMLCDREVKP